MVAPRRRRLTADHDDTSGFDPGAGSDGQDRTPAGAHVRAASRSGEVRFDWADRETWPAALDGATAVYLVASENPSLTRVFVDRAVASGVRRFVALSGRGIGLVPPEPFKGVVTAEEAVRDSGAQWSIIRPNNNNQNFDEGLWRAPLRAGLLGLRRPGRRGGRVVVVAGRVIRVGRTEQPPRVSQSRDHVMSFGPGIYTIGCSRP
ncbi:SDR family oxidoreductase [Saccharopolyspora shandongensis]|uniref:SDR family oxidoreductase n=1 Tax=Saccharopolyspora shandongensis TaxID=418495 RepID=UPI0033F5DD03